MAEKNERERLIAGGFDGLYHPSEPCGCWNEDLYPCGDRPRACRPGHAHGDGIYGPSVSEVQRTAEKEP